MEFRTRIEIEVESGHRIIRAYVDGQEVVHRRCFSDADFVINLQYAANDMLVVLSNNPPALLTKEE